MREFERDAEWKGRAPRQLSLALGDPAQRRRSAPARDKLYFAVVPPPPVAAGIRCEAERQRHLCGSSGKLQSPEVLHVSLVCLGVFDGPPDCVIQAGKHIGSAVEASPFFVTFDRVVSFKSSGNRPFVLVGSNGMDQLVTLRRGLVGAMRKFGWPAAVDRSFTPHVTMMYGRRPMPEAWLDEPFTWMVRDFVLVHSLYGKGRHVHCGRWPLLG